MESTRSILDRFYFDEKNFKWLSFIEYVQENINLHSQGLPTLVKNRKKHEEKLKDSYENN